jgi:hypothetical protein
MFSAKPRNMDKADRAAFSEPGFSTNMTNSSLKKREKLVARILATKFYTKPSGEPGADKEVRLNPVMKDLIINEHTVEHHT